MYVKQSFILYTTTLWVSNCNSVVFCYSTMMHRLSVMNDHTYRNDIGISTFFLLVFVQQNRNQIELRIPSADGSTIFSLVSTSRRQLVLKPSSWLLRSVATFGRSFRAGVSLTEQAIFGRSILDNKMCNYK